MKKNERTKSADYSKGIKSLLRNASPAAPTAPAEPVKIPKPPRGYRLLVQLVDAETRSAAVHEAREIFAKDDGSRLEGAIYLPGSFRPKNLNWRNRDDWIPFETGFRVFVPMRSEEGE